MAEMRSLVIVLGDQLDLDASGFDGFDAAVDAVWMAEVAQESTHVWSSKPRTAVFLSAMLNGKKEGRWLKGDLGDKKYIGEICLNPDDPLLDFHIAELERMRDVEIVIYRNGTAQIQQQYEVTD